MVKYEYMVIYHFQNGFGRICITMDKKIKEYADIEKIDAYLKEQCPEYRGIIVTDFKLLRSYKI